MRGTTSTMGLHFAVRNKLLPEIRDLIENGVNPNVCDEDQVTPLMLCCLEDDEVWGAGVVRMLLQAGAQVGRVDKNGRNALMLCVLFRRPYLTDLLLKAVDFDLEKGDLSGNTILHYAVLGGDTDIVKGVLGAHVRQKIRIRSRNKHGHTAMSLALNMKKLSEVVQVFRATELECTQKDFVVQIPQKILSQPWDNDMQWIKHPDLLRKHMTKEILDQAKVHRIRPIRKYQFQQSPARTKKYNNVKNKTYVQLSPSLSKQRKSAVSTPNENKIDSWRSFVPDHLLILKEQQSLSYRPPAVPVTQSYNDIFDLLVTEETGQTESEDSVSDKMSPTSNPAAVTGRRKSIIKSSAADQANILTRSRSKSDVYDAFAFQGTQGDGKRKVRRSSVHQVANQALMERRKSLARISNERLSPVEEKLRTRNSNS